MRRSLVALGVALATALSSLFLPAVVATVSAAALPPGTSKYISVSPTRLADTREPDAGEYTRLSPNTIRVQVTGRGGVPAGAVAAVVTLTLVNSPSAAFVTAYPAGSALPVASTLNADRPGRIVANLSTVQLSADGAFELFSNVPLELVVDLAGAYVPVDAPTTDGRLVTFEGGARRALDTRDTANPVRGTTSRTVSLDAVGVPADAAAVVVNVGVTEGQPGYWTTYPLEEGLPLASTINIDGPGQTRNAQAIVRLSTTQRAFQVYSQSGGHLIIDVVGYFTSASTAASTDGLFVPSRPLRVLDTREQYSLAPWGSSTIEFGARATVPASAAAMNLTIVDPLNVGFITAFPAGMTKPFVANINVDSFDQIMANHATVGLGTRGVSLFTQSGTHMVADIYGWYLGTPDVSGPVAPNRSTAVTKAVSFSGPGMKTTQVGYGTNLDAIADRGQAAIYGGAGNLGVPEHNIFFAHRTDAGGPLRQMQNLTVGKTFTVLGADGRTFIYLVVETAVIAPIPQVLVNMAISNGPATVTIVACHPLGSTRFRIAAVGRLIGVA